MMTALLGGGIVVLALAVGGAIAATCYALWNVWKSIVPAEQRKQLVWQIGFFLVSGGVAVLLIAASWGVSPTAVYLFGVLCLVALAFGLISVAGSIVLDVRRSRRNVRPQDDGLSKHFHLQRYTRLERK